MALPLRDNIPLDPITDGGYLIGRFDSQRTNVQGVLAAKATPYRAGTQLGKITATNIFKPLDPAATDGSQNWAGTLWGARPASTTTQRAAITTREATINGNLLYYENAVTAPQKTTIEASMSAAGCIVGY